MRNTGVILLSGVILLTDVGEQSHVACPLDGLCHRTLVGGTQAAPLPSKQLGIAGHHLFQIHHVLVVHKGRTWTTLLGAVTTLEMTMASQFLRLHNVRAPLLYAFPDSGSTVKSRGSRVPLPAIIRNSLSLCAFLGSRKTFILDAGLPKGKLFPQPVGGQLPSWLSVPGNS